MDLVIQAAADTLGLNKLIQNYEQASQEYNNLPPKEVLERAYNQAKIVLENPNKWIQMDSDENVLKVNPEVFTETGEKNPLGMLKGYGLKWNPDNKMLYMYDTYDFTKFWQNWIPNRPKEMKIRSGIYFDPTQGSKLLRTSENYNNFAPIYYKRE